MLLQNQNFPPVLTEGECKLERPEQKNENSAKLVLSMMSPLDIEIALAISEEDFRIPMMRKTLNKSDES